MKLRRQICFLFFAVLLTFSSLSPLGAQIMMVDKGDGVHNFYSGYLESNLHFYLFGDGYHSFDQNPVHTYEDQFSNAEAIFFTVEAYEDEEDVADEIVGIPSSTYTDVDREPIDFDNKITVLESWNLVSSKDNYFILMFENTQSSSPISGCVEWHYNATELTIQGDEILDNYGNNWVSNRQTQVSDYLNQGFTHKLVWDFDSLEADEQRFIYIPAICTKNTMERVVTRGVMKDSTCQFIPYNPNNDGNDDTITNAPYYTLSNLVKGYPHDPNCIVPKPGALTVLDEEQTVIKRIYFQNDGTDTATNVTLTFSVYSPVFNLSYFNSSDFCTVTKQGNTQNWIIYFPNIDLPGTGQPSPPLYENTIGWVDLEVCYKLSDFIVDFSNSQVGIEFDSEAPVYAYNTMYRTLDQSMESNCATNSMSMQVVDNWGEVSSHEEELKVYPNPFHESINVVPPGEIREYTLTITDIFGKELIKRKELSGRQYVPTEQFLSGFYLLKIEGNNKSFVTSIIKQ